MVQLIDESPRNLADDAAVEQDTLASRVRATLADLLDLELEDELRYLRGWRGDDLEVVGLG